MQHSFAWARGYKRPMDIEFGPDGALYVIEWGSGFGGDNADSGIYRIDYIAGDEGPDRRRPPATPDHRPRAARRSSSPATARTTRRAAAITYAWDFDGDGTIDSTDPNPSHTYTTNGAYTAKLTVKDAGGPDRRREHADHGRQPRARW